MVLERLKCLNRYQKGILLFIIVMVLVFTVIYPMTIARKGFLYMNTILIPNQKDGNTVYSGEIQGQPACFTVYADKTVEFQYGDEIYGPYTAKEDPTAIPQDSELGEFTTGVELYHGEEILFRGGIFHYEDYFWLCSEDGSIEDSNFLITTSNGIATDENGDVTDSVEPSVTTILYLMTSPELTHKGDWSAWFFGVFVCSITIISILFVDELFRWHLSFQIRNADQAEPSDWEILSRYISWAFMTLVAMVIFINGLR